MNFRITAVLLVAICSTSAHAERNRADVEAVLSGPTSGPAGQWGDWGDWEYCPQGYFAYEFNLKVERSLGSNKDDSAVNAIKLRCKSKDGTRSRRELTSLQGPWGSWGTPAACEYGHFIEGFDVRLEGYQGTGGDDAAVSDIEFKCRDGLTLKSTNGIAWGSFRGIQYCPDNTAVCGIKTRVEPNQGGGDDSALNNLQTACCPL